MPFFCFIIIRKMILKRKMRPFWKMVIFLFSTSFSTFPGILNPGYMYAYEWQIYHMDKLHRYTYICYSYELHACKYDMIDIYKHVMRHMNHICISFVNMSFMWDIFVHKSFIWDIFVNISFILNKTYLYTQTCHETYQ